MSTQLAEYDTVKSECKDFSYHVYKRIDDDEFRGLDKEMLEKRLKALMVLKKHNVITEAAFEEFSKTMLSYYIESLLAEKMKVFNRNFCDCFYKSFLNNKFFHLNERPAKIQRF